MAEFPDHVQTKLLAIKCESCLFAPDPNKLDDINRFLQNPNLTINFFQSNCDRLIFIIQTIMADMPRLISSPESKFRYIFNIFFFEFTF